MRIASVTITVAVVLAFAPAAQAHQPVQIEDESNPEYARTAPLARPGFPAPVQKASAASAAQLGPNLIANPSVETSTSGLPDSWRQGGYGSNTRVFTYPVTGSGGSGTKAISVAITAYTSGDAKWYFNDVPVTGGAGYQFSDVSTSDVASIASVRFTLADGTNTYQDILNVPPSPVFQRNVATFTAPANAVSLTVFHVIKQIGTLVTDDFSLQQVTSTPPPPPNLIANPSVETAGTSGSPDKWLKGGYGSNSRTFTYPVAGSGGSGTKAISVAITAYTGGDAKWYFADVPVTGGAGYRFSDVSTCNVPSFLSVRFALADGTYSYKDLLSVAATSSFRQNVVTLTAPANAVSLTVFHSIKQVGTLVTDDYSLTSLAQGTPAANEVPNPDFENPGANGAPSAWQALGAGSNTRSFGYPVAGRSGRGASVTVSNFISGYAAWAFDPIALAPGLYRFSDYYLSGTRSAVIARYTDASGRVRDQVLGAPAAAQAWTAASYVFTVPVTATGVTVLHALQANGTLTVDDVSVVEQSVFDTGAVSFRFDDGVVSQYQAAAPVLDADGYPGTFYVISRRTADQGYAAYMSKTQVQDLAARGHEIGSHTRTHAHLPQLSVQQQTDEIAGARQDLATWNVGPIGSFAYPFGEYDLNTLSIVGNAGYSSAAATISGYVGPGSDPLQLEYQECRSNLAPGTMQGWVDTAAANHSWLILTFHGLDTSGQLYNCTPDAFRQIVDYVHSKGLPVVTVTQGMGSFKR